MHRETLENLGRSPSAENTCALCLPRRRARVTVDPNGVLQHSDVRIGLSREFLRSDVIAEDHHKFFKCISQQCGTVLMFRLRTTAVVSSFVLT